MGYPLDPAKIKEFAEKAITLMDQQNVPANPNNYALWYNYSAEHDANLTKEIESLIAQGVPFDDIVNSRLFHQFLNSVDDQGKAVSDAADTFETELSNVRNLITDAGKDASDYSNVLNDFSGKLPDIPDPADLGGFVDSLLTETKKREEQASALEQQLENSAQQIDTLQEMLKEARQDALTDALTGIPNRKNFDSSISLATKYADHDNESLCLLVCDIDHFKKFNDTWGHRLGDEVLKLAARTIRATIKSRDMVARIGGEEFAIILPSTDLICGKNAGEQVCEAVKSKTLTVKSTGKTLGSITISIGAAVFRPGEEVEVLIERADKAMYLAKENGRDQVCTEDD